MTEPGAQPVTEPELPNGPIVVVGAGVAGATAALTLRAEGHTGPITLVGAESEHPYRRPPLSKEVLLGSQPTARTLLRPVGSWEGQGVDLAIGRSAVDLDTEGRKLTLDDGTCLPYDRLLLATGSRPRRPAFASAGLPGVHALRTLDDARRLRGALQDGGRLLVIGAGLIGLEAAAAARALGVEVTVLEAAPSALGRTLPTPVAEAVVALHEANGVTVRTGVGVTSLERRRVGGTERLVAGCGDGGEHVADAVLLAVGAEPATELAASAGLAVDDGIVVDAYCATSAPGVWAAGEVTRRPDAFLGCGIRVEHWTDAQDHGAAAARNMLGRPTAFTALPWAWTQHYGTTVQVCGYPAVADEGPDGVAIDGDLHAFDFTARLTRAGELVGAVCAGRPAEFRALREEVGEATRPERT
ncbi:NAD(P)/FAD-dependent oxidoreductase [Streptacidiphilus fuscans]|uniref:FAD-dependent oxidoreductase n=1 Tax=Streptacidiphilus fuscans TaxID=2789292 RepID=A0A931BFD4_9ACTN|nr:FAD-dependent oxidoreductase [Streptacidiphilus fuscans]MBF9072450.1 FAD-dependent oxidoreductase [Streptacidiphilus fuscans]